MFKFPPPARNIEELDKRNRKVVLICWAVIAVLAIVSLIWLK
ncbi:MAG TPA: hypothetical protein VFP71_10005 [Candidatus Angelobacter sp.]|nr:hypothetical protein [Candidatus Angelobacter sp.]